MKWIVFTGVTLAGLVAVGVARLRSRQPPLVVNIKADGNGCRVTVEGRKVSQQELLQIAVQSKSRRAIVIYEKAAPYKCVGAAIIALQQAGLNNVDSAVWNGA